MKLIIYSLLWLLLAVAAAVFLSRDSGQVVLAYSDYAVQTSLGLFVFLLVIGFVLLYVVIRILTGLVDLPEAYRRRQRTRQHGRSEYFLTQGMLALNEGDWHAAEKLLRKGATYSRAPMINYMGAAKAAQHLGALDRRDHYLSLASASPGGSSLAAGITQAELQLEQHQAEQAYAILRKLHADKPGNNLVRSMMLDASRSLREWQQMLELLYEFERKGGMPLQNIRAGQLQAHAELLIAASRSGDITNLNMVWGNIPAKLKKEMYLIQVYVSARLKFPDTSDCEPLLRDIIRDKRDPALVRLYGLVQGKDEGKQLAFAEKLLAANPGDGMLLLTAGRLYKRAALWGRAKYCLEESLKLYPSPETCYEMANMFQGQGDGENAGKYFREGLALATTQLPALPQNLTQ